MNEKNVFAFEKKKELFPIEREVTAQIESIANGREYVDIRDPVFDEQGLSRMEVQTTDENGEKMDISYTRDRKVDGVVIPTLHQTLYYEGIPCGAGTQYDYIEGEWKEIS